MSLVVTNLLETDEVVEFISIQILGSACDWLSRGGNLLRPIRSTNQIWLVTRHQYGISALVPQTSFRWETSGIGFTKCRLFSQAP